MNKNLNIGDEVLIFENKRYKNKLGIEKFITGRVKSHRLSDDLSHHGSPWYADLYTVIGEDNKEYIGSYSHSVIGNAYFYTKEDYINHLNNIIDDNKEQIDELTNNIIKIQSYIDIIKSKDNTFTIKK